MGEMTEEEFDARFHPDLSVRSEHYDDGRLETFGEDLKVLEKILKDTPRCVWTMIDGDDGSVWLSAGFHLVNRICYLITEEEWNTGTEECRLG